MCAYVHASVCACVCACVFVHVCACMQFLTDYSLRQSFGLLHYMTYPQFCTISVYAILTFYFDLSARLNDAQKRAALFMTCRYATMEGKGHKNHVKQLMQKCRQVLMVARRKVFSFFRKVVSFMVSSIRKKQFLPEEIDSSRRKCIKIIKIIIIVRNLYKLVKLILKL